MVKIKLVDPASEDLRKLVVKLDIELIESYGDLQHEYNKFNIIEEDDIAVIAFFNDTAV